MANSIEELLKETERLIKAEKEQEALALLESELRNPLYSLKEQNDIANKISILKKFLSQND
ncbi:MAG: hypothetical protein MJ233_05355 [Mycoplasmoidaceae bacterium]|nr:hypothetical protein [Mycoplasmoidaceae bacterium]